MASFKFITDFPVNNPVQFYAINAPVNSNQNSLPFFKSSYAESRQWFQTEKPYCQKFTFADIITIMVHTQANEVGSSVPYPELDLYKQDGTLVSTISIPPYNKGHQQIAGNTFNDDGDIIQLNTYCWQFSFGSFLSADTDSGSYYLLFTNTASDNTTTFIHQSEPISVAQSHYNTRLIQGQNFTNRAAQNWVINGWGDPDFNPISYLRIESSIEDFDPKSLYVGYLEQNYNARQLRSQNYASFELNLGSVSSGIPYYMYQKASEVLIMDDMRIDYEKYIYDIEGSDNNIKKVFKKTDPRASQLVWATFPIRLVSQSQLAWVVKLPLPLLPLWRSPWHDPAITNPSGADFMPYSLPSVQWQVNGVSANFGGSIIYDEAGEDTLISNLNSTLLPLVGFAGTIVRDDNPASDTYGYISYSPAAGETAFMLSAPQVLYRYFVVLCDNSMSSTGTFQFVYVGRNGTLSSQVIDWNAGYAGLAAGSVYSSSDGAVNTVTHNYTGAMPSSFDVAIFHNNTMSNYQFDQSTFTNITLNSFFNADYWGMQADLQQFTLVNAGPIAATTGGALLNALNSCAASLQRLLINDCSIGGFADLFLQNFASATVIQLKGNVMNSAAVDEVFNELVANSPGVLSHTGSINISHQSPTAPPTSASSAARLALGGSGAGWTISTD